MTVSHVEVLVEEQSMEAALRILFSNELLVPSFRIHAYQGKMDLLEKLPARLQGYAQWIPEDYRILVIIDRDDDDCYALKAQLEQTASGSGVSTRSNPGDTGYQVANRLAIEELEAWYFGDWDAVSAAYPKVPNTIPGKRKYRDPDAIAGGTWEAFERILQRAGYHQAGLRKIEAARAIATHWRPERNRSHSFQVFYKALQEMAMP